MNNPKPNQATTADMLRRELLGNHEVDLAATEVYGGPVMKTFIEVTNNLVFDGLWSRPGLDLKTRSLVCVVSDAATGQTAILPTHLRMALRQGWTETELTEVLIQLIGYVGSPLARQALLSAEKVFSDRRDDAQRANTQS